MTSPGSSVLTFVLVGVGVLALLALLVVVCVAGLAALLGVQRRQWSAHSSRNARSVAMESPPTGEYVEYAELVPEREESTMSHITKKTKEEEKAAKSQYTSMPAVSPQASEYAQLPDKHKQALIAAGHVIDFAEVELGATLGEGQFGVVYHSMWRRAPVAVKELKSFDTKQIEEFEREAELHKRLPPHANVVQFLAVTSGARLCIVVEFVAGGCLERRGCLLGMELLGIARGVAAGMAHLHAHEVIHRDLAARNVLLSREGKPKVTDFGMSRLVVTGEYVTQSNVLPLKWLAPETVQTRAFTKASDVWSHGVKLFECVVGHAPWPELSGFEVSRRVGHERAVPEVPEACAVLTRCVGASCVSPRERPSFVEVL